MILRDFNRVLTGMSGYSRAQIWKERIELRRIGSHKWMIAALASSVAEFVYHKTYTKLSEGNTAFGPRTI